MISLIRFGADKASEVPEAIGDDRAMWADGTVCKCPSADAHPCPFQMEINHDHDFTCDCCEYCEGECAQDI